MMSGEKICLMADVSVGKSGLVSTSKNLISTFLIKCGLNIISETSDNLVSVWGLTQFVSYNLGCNLQVTLGLQSRNYLITEPR